MASAELVEQVLGHLDPSVIEAHSRHFAPQRFMDVIRQIDDFFVTVVQWPR
jgi:hypothetical protein